MREHPAGFPLFRGVEPSASSLVGSSVNVLVVADDSIVAALLAEALRLEGHEAAIVHEGARAPEVVASAAFDAVLLDLEMPGVNGVDVLRQIRSRHPLLPVLLLAKPSSRSVVSQAVELGVVGVLEKPIVLARLSAALARLMRR